jgi:hypothetical protein
MPQEKSFEESVAELLRQAGIPFETKRALGGIQPDFVVNAPDGRLLIVEAKAWEKSPGFTIRAAQQAKLYKSETDADSAFVVVKELDRSRPSTGVVTLNDLVPTLKKELTKAESAPDKKAQLLKPSAKSVFAAMPFSSDYEDVFFIAMAHAAKAVGAVCRRVDYEEYAGDIVEQIKQMIRESIAVIADLSEGKPNVLYEAGFAHALGKPTIHLCSTPLKDLPFDVSQWNTLPYKKGQVHQLRRALKRRLRAIVS